MLFVLKIFKTDQNDIQTLENLDEKEGAKYDDSDWSGDKVT